MTALVSQLFKLHLNFFPTLFTSSTTLTRTMAILNGLPVSIEVNGNSLDEYRDHDNQEVRLDSISKYIESFFSAAFAIRVSIPKIFSFTSDALGVFLYLDGTYVESGIFEKGLHDYRFKGTFGVGEGGLGYKEFTLNEIKRPLIDCHLQQNSNQLMFAIQWKIPPAQKQRIQRHLFSPIWELSLSKSFACVSLVLGSEREQTDLWH